MHDSRAQGKKGLGAVVGYEQDEYVDDWFGKEGFGERSLSNSDLPLPAILEPHQLIAGEASSHSFVPKVGRS